MYYLENIQNGDLNGIDTRWVDTKSIMKILGVSKSTLYRKIDEDDLKTKDGHKVLSKKVGNSRLYGVSDEVLNQSGIPFNTFDIPKGSDNTSIIDDSKSIVYDDRYTKKLEQDNEYLRKQIETLQSELSETRKRTDTIIMNFTGQIEQKLLEENNKPFWKRWFS